MSEIALSIVRYQYWNRHNDNSIAGWHKGINRRKRCARRHKCPERDFSCYEQSEFLHIWRDFVGDRTELDVSNILQRALESGPNAVIIEWQKFHWERFICIYLCHDCQVPYNEVRFIWN